MIGKRLAHYDITGHLGSGGMGDVYQATDSKLGRSVAIKLLPEAFARDAERVARFEREARVLASLNHSHIAAIYGIEQVGERKFLVMELVSGETLAERIKRGPIPVEESLGIARQIAQALEAAHDKGVIHRDLKPANIKINSEGQVKVLDFGLAKVSKADTTASLSNSPTMVSASTPGTILGTAAYMAPEQAKGREAGRTADIWSFGCVLYEMLTGRTTFDGETLGEVLGAVFRAEPDWRRLPVATPHAVRRLLRRCLVKDPRDRLQDMGDARIELSGTPDPDDANVEDRSATRLSTRRERLAWVAFALVALIAAAALLFDLRPPPIPPEMRLEITTPPTRDSRSFALSLDGRQIAFVAGSEGKSLLFVRSVESGTVRSLPGTEGVSSPSWSPSGDSIAFRTEGKLKRIDIASGAVQSLANAGLNGSPGAWNREGDILFTTTGADGIWRISAAGGDPVSVTQIGEQQGSHGSPVFLPDGKHFLYSVTGSPEQRGIYAAALGQSEVRRLIDVDSRVAYVSPRKLLFVREGTLFAQEFDPENLVLSGTPWPVADGVSAFSASESGSIAFRPSVPGGDPGATNVSRRLVWLDRSGSVVETIGDQFGSSLSLSPDGRRVAVHNSVNGNIDVWLIDLERAVSTRFTFDPANDIHPLWSPDGARLVFSSNRRGNYDLYEKAASGSGAENVLIQGEGAQTRSDWSPDNRFLLYRTVDPKTLSDLWALPMDGERKPFPVLQGGFEERDAQFSPDGQWIAYQSNESGRFEIYVQPFSGPASKFQVSTDGGVHVRWRQDGTELFYVALDGRMMAVPVRWGPEGKTVELGTPSALFLTHFPQALQGIDPQQYVVSADGQRFLMSDVAEQASPPITLILNWKASPKL